MEIYQPTAKHTHTVIFLHGRDSTAKEFAPEFFESQASDDRTLPEIFPGTKWVFPSADMISSARFGSELSQWFDMHTTEDPHEREDEQDLTASISRIRNIIAQEVALIGPENVVLGGISQGFAVAIHALLGGEIRLAGTIGLCSWVARRVALEPYKNTTAIETPALLAHAKDDDVIEFSFGEELCDTLSALGMNVRWRSYADGGHWINEPQGVDDIAAFLETVGMKSC